MVWERHGDSLSCKETDMELEQVTRVIDPRDLSRDEGDAYLNSVQVNDNGAFTLGEEQDKSHPQRGDVSHVNGEGSKQEGRPRWQGYALAFVAMLALSPDALLSQLVATTEVNAHPNLTSLQAAWVVGCWRALIRAASLLVPGVWIIVHHVRTRPDTPLHALFPTKAMLGSVAAGLTNTLFPVAIAMTRATNVLLILGTLPMWAALWMWLLTKQAPSTRVVIVSLVAIVCVVVLSLEGFLVDEVEDGGEVKLKTWRGDLLALLVANTQSLMLVLVDSAREVSKHTSIVLVLLVSGLFGGLATIPIVSLSVGLPGIFASISWLYLAVLGTFVTTLSFFGMLLSAKFISPAEVSLISLLELVFGPIWIFIAFQDPLSGWTIGGGVALVITLLINGGIDVYLEHRNKTNANHTNDVAE
eukprot:m.362405 g.362405  ORF g.362405 m.362405 type:complete len:415 (-) comp20441_c0_seq1:205-1449(-)